jgi:hypothetical protein
LKYNLVAKVADYQQIERERERERERDVPLGVT